MYIYLKHVEKFGFKVTCPFSSSYDYVYYRVNNNDRSVVGITNDYNNPIFRFDLNKDEFKQFESGKLSLIPPDCCSASGRKKIEKFKILHNKNLKNAWELKRVLKNLDII